MKQGDIVLVPFPYSDLSAQKTRPAVVVSNHTLKGDDVLLMGMTSQRSGKLEVTLTIEDLEKGKLPVVSYLRLSKVVCLNKNIVRKVVGRISQKKRQEVCDGLQRILNVGL